MKRIATLLAALVLGGATAQMSLPQEGDSFFAQGQATLERMTQLEPNTNQARNVILFVSDGAGPAIVTATRIFEGQRMGLLGEDHVLSFETFPYVAVTKTYNSNAQTPDSAGTSTAMNTGVKTKQGVLGVSQDVLRGECATAQGREVVTLAEMAEMAGMATGVVSTARITHATPAAAYAHAADRNWEDDSDLPPLPFRGEGAGCIDIAQQLVDFPFGDGIDVALGGGRRHFIGANQLDPEDAGETGDRTDGRDLTADWEERGGVFVYDRAGFDALDPSAPAQVLGLFERSHMEYEADREADTGGEPSLAEMTAFAIEKLSNNPNGFVLTVEAGRVDHAAHAGNAYRMLTDNVAFAEAVQTALDMVDPSETLIIVTADHAHTVTLSGYAQRGNPILGLVRGLDGQGLPVDDPVLAADEKPYTSIGFANGPGAADIIGQSERPDLSEEMVQDPEFLQQALIPLSSETHGGTDIVTYAQGPQAHLMGGVVEQSYLFHVMERALDLRTRAEAGGALRPGFETRAQTVLSADRTGSPASVVTSDLASSGDAPTVAGTLDALEGGLAGVPADVAATAVGDWANLLGNLGREDLQPIVDDLNELEDVLTGSGEGDPAALLVSIGRATREVAASEEVQGAIRTNLAALGRTLIEAGEALRAGEVETSGDATP